MTAHYTIDIAYGAASLSNDDLHRAHAAIDAALLREGITTDNHLMLAQRAFIARCEAEAHDAALANAFERVQQAGDLALTEGWRDPNGASLYLGAAG